MQTYRDYANEHKGRENNWIHYLTDNKVCLNCMKCNKRNCTSNKYKGNLVLYKRLTGTDYNK